MGNGEGFLATGFRAEIANRSTQAFAGAIVEGLSKVAQKEAYTAITIAVSIFGNNSPTKRYDLLKVESQVSTKKDDKYTGLYFKKTDELTYKRLPRLTLKNLCINEAVACGVVLADKQANDFVNTVINYAGMSFPDASGKMVVYYGSVTDALDDNLIELPFGNFFDKSMGTIRDSITENEFCFRKLFDTDEGDSNSRHNLYVPIEELASRKDLFNSSYVATIDALEKNDGVIRYKGDGMPPGIDFVWDWANHDNDTYSDLLNSFAEGFVDPEKMQPGAYFYAGEGRNGKSTAIVFMRTIWGKNNCGDANIAQIDDPHKLMQLKDACVNLSTESGALDKMEDHQEAFKQIAAHEPLSMNVFHRNETETISGKFMNYFAMNYPPKWTGDGAMPLVARTLIIYFLNDFSSSDGSGRDFIRDEIVVPDKLMVALGIILAIASYRTNGHPFKKSKTMQMAIDECMQESNSPKMFRQEFAKYFVGYSSARFMGQEYSAMCIENEWEIKKRKEMASSFMDFRRIGEKTIGGKQYKNIYFSQSVRNQYNFVLTKDMDVSALGIPDVHTVEDFYDKCSGSLITAMRSAGMIE